MGLIKVQSNRNDNKRLNDSFDTVFANNSLQKPLIFSFDEVDSTNTEARIYAEGEGAGLCDAAVFFSRVQRAGRGTRMRSFESPRGGLYMSLLIFGASCDRLMPHATALAAVAVCRALRRVRPDIDAKIKWVNDITVNDKKLSGILCESSLDEYGGAKYIIIGIGLNIEPGEHSEEVLSIMTTLFELGVKASAEELCAIITEELLLHFDKEKTDIMNEYRRLSSLVGRDVTVFSSDENYIATALAIADDGALVCKKDTGEIVNLVSADVSVRV